VCAASELTNLSHDLNYIFVIVVLFHYCYYHYFGGTGLMERIITWNKRIGTRNGSSPCVYDQYVTVYLSHYLSIRMEMYLYV
jgi:hypothetical protein